METEEHKQARIAFNKLKNSTCKNARQDGEKWELVGCTNPRRPGSSWCQKCSEEYHNPKDATPEEVAPTP
jgi:hypothetical protein